MYKQALLRDLQNLQILIQTGNLNIALGTVTMYYKYFRMEALKLLWGPSKSIGIPDLNTALRSYDTMYKYFRLEAVSTLLKLWA